MAAKRYFVRVGGQDKGPYTLSQLREAVEQTALSGSVPVRADGSDAEEPLAALLQRTRKPPKEAAPAPVVDGAEEAAKRRVASQWRIVLLVLSILVLALRLMRLASY